VAKGSDIVVFNRGHKADWATEIFKDLASEWHNVQEMDAVRLAQAMHVADIDVLYDLGGWMDPVGLKALSVKPAKQMFKWVGGQSVTTGLDNFDGWIGDEAQSPLHLQYLYTEPLVNIKGGYATYTSPDYLPPTPKRKSDVPVVFSNPAKVSRAFLAKLQAMPGKKCFVHRQFQYPQARARVEEALGAANVEFVLPNSHKEALEVLGQHKVMLDTFPYSSGLTAREAQAMGVSVQAKVGTLFCERHCANLVA
jgi:predicted O-linked N-acetylglucosamine transferase (SPINDLY family)